MKECPVCHKVGFHKLSCGNNTARVAIPMTMHTAFIPTLEGDEAEEFIRKADENVRLMKQRRCNELTYGASTTLTVVRCVRCVERQLMLCYLA
jgi:hypothetical protein